MVETIFVTPLPYREGGGGWKTGGTPPATTTLGVKMLNLTPFFNSPASEFELVAINPRTLEAVAYPRRSTGQLEQRLDKMRAAGLFFAALALFNQTAEFSYSWPLWLESRHGVGCELEKVRRASREYHGLIDVYMKVHPGPEVYSIEVDAVTGRCRVLGLRT